jgi:hypothetical protein
MGWNVEFDVPIAGWEETTTNFISNATVGANFEVVEILKLKQLQPTRQKHQI